MEYPENHVLLRAAFLITLLAAQLSKESEASKRSASRGLTFKKMSRTQCCGSGGSVINWPPGSGSVILPNPDPDPY